MEPGVAGICVPEPVPYSVIPFLNRYCLPNAQALINSTYTEFYDTAFGKLALHQIDMWINDTMQCTNIYLIAVGSAVLLVWLWNVFLRAFAEVLAWVSIFIVGIGLIATGFLIRNYNIQNYPEGTKT